MKVLHVIPSVSLNRGGPSFAIRAMTRELVRQGVEVEIATTDDDGAGRNISLTDSCRQEAGVTIQYFRRDLGFYCVSRSFIRWLKIHARDYDVIHIHALFSHTSIAAGLIAKKQGVPYIVRPLGVLNRWGMENRRRFLKQWSFHLLDKKVVDGAALMHFTSEAEKKEAVELGVCSESIVLPLGLDLSEYEVMPAPHEVAYKYSQVRGRVPIVFLSRLDPIKGLDLLLPAFSRLRSKYPQALLILAGEGETAFVQSLRDLATQLRIAEDILWAGFVSGREKLELLAAADIYVLPSYSENFGIAAMEAMAAGAPTIISNQVGFAAAAVQERAALVVPCEVEALTQALMQLAGDENKRRILSQNGRRLAREKYSIETMGHKLICAYCEILRTSRPKCTKS